MTDFTFPDAVAPVRSDIGEAHRQVWERLARAGSWWTGEERVAIARAVREAADCRLCAERAGALSPLAVQGDHDHDGVLSGAAVEVVHQVVNDPGRLSQTWYEKVLADGLSPEQYVETLGVVVAVCGSWIAISGGAPLALFSTALSWGDLLIFASPVSDLHDNWDCIMSFKPAQADRR